MALVFCILALSILAQPLGVFAQQFKPACNEVLRLSSETFINLFTAQNVDYSELGYDNAARYWANCKRADNLKRLEKTPQVRARLEELRKQYIQLFSAETELALQFYGGGTLYTHALNRFGVELEAHLSDLIALMQSPLGATDTEALKGWQDETVQVMEQRIQSLKETPARKLGYTTREKWNAAVEQYEAAYQQILRIAGSRVDITRFTILEFVRSPLFLEEMLK